MSRRTTFAAIATAAALLAVPAAASAADGPCYSPPSKPKVISHVKYGGMQSILYCMGPITIRPGQNTNDYTFNQHPGSNNLLPNTPGWITRFDPDLIYADKTKGNRGVPSVDVLHLHHAVWLGMGENDPRWAAGEEKTVVQLPQGYGYRNDPTRSLTINYMIHNLFPTTEKVYLTWRLDFVPDTAAAAASIKRAQTLWLDVAGIKQYPVFDALRGMGSGGKYTFPNQTTGAETAKIGSRHQYTAPINMTLLETAGHLHPGGLSTTLKASRGSLTKTLFTSKAHYYEPAGAVSWDVAMGGTSSNWRVKLKAGDKLNVSTTYDVSKASWYESMGIMPVAVYFGDSAGGTDWTKKSLSQTQLLTHSHLAENNGHGGKSVPGAVIPTLLPNGIPSDGTTIPISDFIYSLGDFSNSGSALNPPTVKQGGNLTFRSDDVTGNPYTDYALHTITSCKNPCNKSTGIAYPRADADPSVMFDSGELGSGPEGTAASGRRTWTVPTTLPAAAGPKGTTYSYFCRVHPYMRGSFRVLPN